MDRDQAAAVLQGFVSCQNHDYCRSRLVGLKPDGYHILLGDVRRSGGVGLLFGLIYRLS
jgi:hypothetical protein